MGEEFILNVNDDEANRYLLTHALEKAGYAVREASTGSAALEEALLGPALILLDVNLPDISGLTVCRELKANALTERIPVLHTSATFTSAELRTQGLESGADGYLVHPIDPAELVATIRAYLRARRAEDALNASGREWERTFESLTDAVCIVDASGTALHFNPAMCALTGKDRATVQAGLEAVLPGGLVATVSRLRSTARAEAMELALDDRFFRVVLDPLSQGDDTVDRIVMTFSDITDRRRLEEQHRRRAEELAEEARRKDEFLAMLAHELRNPLHAIGLSVRLQQKIGAQDARNEELRQGTLRQVDNLARMVDDLLDVSRVTRGTISLKLERLELSTIVDVAVAAARPSAARRKQTIIWDRPQVPTWVEGDPLRLEQVIGNLLGNAIRHNVDGIVIAVTLVREVDALRLSVKDDGRGLDPKELEAVFETFVQLGGGLDRSRGGLGIGLPIARSLAELHGGRLEGRSEGIGKGAEFEVRFPAASSGPGAMAANEGDEHDSPPPMSIVLVEDHPEAGPTLATWLRTLGHDVMLATHGEAGAELILEHLPTLALVDIGLPGIDGFEVARRVRQRGAKGVYLVAQTGYGRPEDQRRATDAGFDGFLVKPVPATAMLRTLRSACAEIQPRRHKVR